MRKLLIILSVGLAVSPVFAHNGMRVTSQQSVAVYAGAQGVLRYAGGGDTSGAGGWGRPVSHTLDDGDTVYLVARAGEVAMEGILAEVRIPGEQLRMSGDERWEMFTIRPDVAPLGGAPDESTLFDWVNRANDARAWKFPDLSGTNHSSSPEFLEGIEASAARMSRRLAGGTADLGKGAPEFVVCRLRVAKDQPGGATEEEKLRESDREATGKSDNSAGDQSPVAHRPNPGSSGGGAGGGGGSGGGGTEFPGLLDPPPGDPTTDISLTDPVPDPTIEPPTAPTPVINTPTPPTIPQPLPPMFRPEPRSPREPSEISMPPDPTVPTPTPILGDSPRNPPSEVPPDTVMMPNVPSPGTLAAAGLGVAIAAIRRRRRAN